MQIKELYSHTTNDITVYVEIDYANNKISLMEPVGNHCVFREKKWLFAGRGKEYMKGWRNILEAMTAAINDAERRLSLYKEEIGDQEIRDMVEFMDKKCREFDVIK